MGPQQKSRNSGIFSLNGLGEKFMPSGAQRNRGKPSSALRMLRRSKGGTILKTLTLRSGIFVLENYAEWFIWIEEHVHGQHQDNILRMRQESLIIAMVFLDRLRIRKKTSLISKNHLFLHKIYFFELLLTLKMLP